MHLLKIYTINSIVWSLKVDYPTWSEDGNFDLTYILNLFYFDIEMLTGYHDSLYTSQSSIASAFLDSQLEQMNLKEYLEKYYKQGLKSAIIIRENSNTQHNSLG